jgi:small redox-active disulfide protein 2
MVRFFEEIPMKIQIVGMGCPKCKKLYEGTKEAAKALNIVCEIEKIEDIDAITNMGISFTPALVVDGVLKVMGRVPSLEELKKLLR